MPLPRKSGCFAGKKRTVPTLLFPPRRGGEPAGRQTQAGSQTHGADRAGCQAARRGRRKLPPARRSAAKTGEAHRLASEPSHPPVDSGFLFDTGIRQNSSHMVGGHRGWRVGAHRPQRGRAARTAFQNIGSQSGGFAERAGRGPSGLGSRGLRQQMGTADTQGPQVRFNDHYHCAR